ncbi:hypothetical protein AGR5A_Cc110008 [Agrobacterium genomosp. 5 str. CFBP 6626]|nr:hypothetical protein AGR5A_Cc110008 [Agrobacterium genomosp. 5 str. CFBP 6626]
MLRHGQDCVQLELVSYEKCATADMLLSARPFGQTRVFGVPVSPANASAGQKGGRAGGCARSRKYPCEASFLDTG